MGVVVAVALSVIARRFMRVAMARGVGMSVHFYEFYSTRLPPRLHPEVSGCYWKL